MVEPLDIISSCKIKTGGEEASRVFKLHVGYLTVVIVDGYVCNGQERSVFLALV
jgi:hypothetical protein